MRRAASTITCLVVAILPMGCQTPSARPPDGQSIVVEGGGKFPAALAGTWKADRDGWEFVIERDGRISSAVIGLGQVRITPGKSETLPTQGGGEGLFEPGPWTVYCNPKTNEVIVKIIMRHVRVGMAEAILEGTSTDTFSGPMSPADDVWHVQWTNFSVYQLQMPDGSASELSTDETYGETSSLTFERVSQP